MHHSNLGSEFVELVLDNFLIQHVDEPTREKNIFDLVLSSEESMIENLEVKELFSSSDHNMIHFNLIGKTEMPLNNVIKFNFSRADYLKITSCLKEIDWELKFQNTDVNIMWNTFCEVLNEVIVTYVPKMTNRSKKFPVWMTKEAKKQRKNKVRMWKGY